VSKSQINFTPPSELGDKIADLLGGAVQVLSLRALFSEAISRAGKIASSLALLGG